MKAKLPLLQAAIIAQSLMIDLTPYCERLEIAGSIRRAKSEIGDIDLVAVPRYAEPDMFGALSENHTLDLVDWSKFGKLIKGGHKYKQIALPEGMNLELWIVTPPAQWGVIYLIRTGPEEYGHKMVTVRANYGYMPSNYKFKDGAIWNQHNHIIPTPEEKDVFDLFGMKYTEPELRQA